MKNIVFNYHKKTSKCRFCSREKNPHPDYDEPLVTTIFQVSSNKMVEICINCFEEINLYSKKNKKDLTKIIKEKLNLSNLLKKYNVE